MINLDFAKKKIDETRNYPLEETKHNDIMIEKHSKVYRDLNHFEQSSCFRLYCQWLCFNFCFCFISRCFYCKFCSRDQNFCNHCRNENLSVNYQEKEGKAQCNSVASRKTNYKQSTF